MVNEIKRLYNLINMYGLSSKNYPERVEDAFQEAINEKRAGNYEKSLSLINDIIERLGVAYTSLLNGAFKTIASAGYLYDTKRILIMCDKKLQDSHISSMWGQVGLPNNFSEHLERLAYASRDKELLKQYLTSISGNPNFEFERDYETMVKELYQ